MICGCFRSIDAPCIDTMPVNELRDVYENYEQFGCSFVSKENLNDDPMSHCKIDLDSMRAFYSKTILSIEDEGEGV